MLDARTLAAECHLDEPKKVAGRLLVVGLFAVGEGRKLVT